jgi:hypothetical protein
MTTRTLRWRDLVATFWVLAALVACGGGTGGQSGDTALEAADVAPADTTDDAAEPDARAPCTTFRRPIGPDAPLIVYNVYGGTPTSHVDHFHALLPDDVRAAFALHLVPSSKDDTPENRAWIEGMLAAAEAWGMPSFVQAESFSSRSDVPMSYWDELFDRFPHFLGLAFAELSASNLTLKGMDADHRARLARALETVAAHDGYLLWQDMGYDNGHAGVQTPHVFVQAGADPALFHAIEQYGRHLIVMDKKNGTGKRFGGPAAAVGWWLSGLVGNWGVNSEDWLWWESGYGRLFEPSSGKPRTSDDWMAVFTFPDALFGLDWLTALSNGATVFSLEAPFHGYAGPDALQATPAFLQVLLPLIRQMLSRPLIPTLPQVLARVPAAALPAGPNPTWLQDDALFQGLYGPAESSLYEWLPSTGRYGVVAVLPALAGPESLAPFARVWDDATLTGELASPGARAALLEPLCPPPSSGDAWVVPLPGAWALANPRENEDVDATFLLLTASHPDVTLAGSLPAHTFALAFEDDDALRLHLSNHRIDSDADVWGNPLLEADDPMGWVSQVYLAGGNGAPLRTTSLRVVGPWSAAPAVQATPTAGIALDQAWDAATGTLQLSIGHNGPVDVAIPWE